MNDIQEWLSGNEEHFKYTVNISLTLILASLNLSQGIVKGIAEVLKASNQLDVRHDVAGCRIKIEEGLRNISNISLFAVERVE